MGKVRLVLPASLGGPNAPVNGWLLRVSTRRQGVIPTKTRAPEADWAWAEALPTVANECAAVAAWASTCVGCQYSGAGQFFSAAKLRSGAIWAVSSTVARTRRETIRIIEFNFTKLLLFHWIECQSLPKLG